MYHEAVLFMKEWNQRTSRPAFLRAVITVFEAFLAGGREPSCTYYVANHAYLSEQAMPRVLEEWSALTGLDATLFPWRLDEVATTWEEWRKCNLKYREQFLRQLNLCGLADSYHERQAHKAAQS